MPLPKPPVKQVKDRWIGAVIEPVMDEQLSRYAKKHNVSKSAAIRFILASFFDGSFQKSKVDSQTGKGIVEAVQE